MAPSHDGGHAPARVERRAEAMIEKLTPEQEALMDVVVKEYEDAVFNGDDSYDLDLIKRGMTFFYKLAELKSPDVIVCTSPLDLAVKSGLKPGETYDWFGCGYDSGWTAFYDFFERIGVKYEEEWHFTLWKEFILHSGVFATVMREGTAYVSVKPMLVARNASGDLHSETGPAIAWRDGYEEYFLNGVAVGKELVMTPPEKLDAKMILKEENAEVRREIVRKIGIDIVCQKLDAKVLDRKEVKYSQEHTPGAANEAAGITATDVNSVYELLSLDLGDGTHRPYLKMLNPSIGVWHVEGVHPDCKSVDDALKWRNQTAETPTTLT